MKSKFILMMLLGVVFFQSPVISISAQQPAGNSVKAEPVSQDRVISLIDDTTANPATTITPPFDPAKLTPASMFDTLIDPIYSVLVLLLGLLSAWVPGLRRIENKAIRVASIGIVLALGFVMWGGASFWKVALSYVFANLTYIITVKPLAKPAAAPPLE